MQIMMYKQGSGSGNISLENVAYSNNQFDTGTNRTGSVYVPPDGSKIYYARFDANTWSVADLSTPFDLSTIGTPTTFSNSFAWPRWNMDTYENGTRFAFMAENNSNTPAFYVFSGLTPYDLQTATTLDFGAFLADLSPDLDGAVHAAQFNDDGTKLFVMEGGGTGPSIIARLTCTTPWNPGTATWDGNFFDIQNDLGNNLLGSFQIVNNGSTLIVVGDSANTLFYEYTLSTPWNLSSVSLTNSYNFSSQGQARSGFVVGSHLYMVRTTGIIYQYDLG